MKNSTHVVEIVPVRVHDAAIQTPDIRQTAPIGNTISRHNQPSSASSHIASGRTGNTKCRNPRKRRAAQIGLGEKEAESFPTELREAIKVLIPHSGEPTTNIIFQLIGHLKNHYESPEKALPAFQAWCRESRLDPSSLRSKFEHLWPQRQKRVGDMFDFCFTEAKAMRFPLADVLFPGTRAINVRRRLLVKLCKALADENVPGPNGINLAIS